MLFEEIMVNHTEKKIIYINRPASIPKISESK